MAGSRADTRDFACCFLLVSRLHISSHHAMARSTTSTQSPVAFAPPLIGSDEIAEVIATLESGWLTTGPRVAASSARSPDYAGAAHAVAAEFVHGGAPPVAARGAGSERDDEVVTTPLTFCATANVDHACRRHAGLRRRRSLDTGNLDPSAAAAAFTARTRALLPVHFAGRPVDVVGFHDLARRHGVPVIEDAAHCVEGDRRRTQGRFDRRLHLFQLLRHQEPDDGRRRDGDDERCARGGVHPHRLAARHEPRRVDALCAGRPAALRRRRWPASNTT